jgi:hypothetical protein
MTDEDLPLRRTSCAGKRSTCRNASRGLRLRRNRRPKARRGIGNSAGQWRELSEGERQRVVPRGSNKSAANSLMILSRKG